MLLALGADQVLGLAERLVSHDAADPGLDRIVRLAADLFHAPTALAALFHTDSLQVLASSGIEPGGGLAEGGLKAALAGGSTVVGDGALMVGDRPLIAAAPLVGGSEVLIGGLFVLGPSDLPPPDAEALARLAALAELADDRLQAARAEAMAASRLQLLDFVEQTVGAGHWFYEAGSQSVIWSEEMYRLTGLDPKGPAPDLATVIGLYPPDERRRFEAYVEDAIVHGSGLDSVVGLRRRDGDLRHMHIRSRALRDAGGAVIGLFGVMQDVTEQQLRLKAAERSRARYQLLADNMADVVTRIRMDGSSSYISPAIEALIGYKPQEMAGRSAQAFVWPGDRHLVLGAFARMAQGDSEFTLQHRAQHRDGHAVWVETRFQLIRDAGGRPIEMVAVLRNIDERKQAEDAHAESEARYSLIAENARDIISRTRLNGTVLYISPSVATVAGYDPGEIIGQTIQPMVHPEDLTTFQTVFQELAEGVREGGQPVRYRICHKDGRWIWIQGNPTLLLDSEGRPCEFVDVSRDVTDQVVMEQELVAARDAADAGAKAKSEFLANISHELRTPLTAVIGFAGMLSIRPELSPESRRFVERLQVASRALLSTINDVLDFSTLESGRMELRVEPTDLRAVVGEVGEVLGQQAADKGLTLHTDVSDDIPTTLPLDRGRVRQVLLNLVGNAVKFTAEGRVAVRLTMDQPQILRVEVSDTGPGISAEERQRLFQRFSQVDASATRAHGGTGLGLAICKGLVEAMGGQIGVTSEPGEGSTFWFTLPAATESSRSEA
jgi:PAS domain S-box-containing protein